MHRRWFDLARLATSGACRGGATEPPDAPCATAAEVEGRRLSRIQIGAPARTNLIGAGARVRIRDE